MQGLGGTAETGGPAGMFKMSSCNGSLFAGNEQLCPEYAAAGAEPGF